MNRIEGDTLFVRDQYESVTHIGYKASHNQLSQLLMGLILPAAEPGIAAKIIKDPDTELKHQACENVARAILLDDEEMRLPVEEVKKRVTDEIGRLTADPKRAGASRGLAAH